MLLIEAASDTSASIQHLNTVKITASGYDAAKDTCTLTFYNAIDLNADSFGQSIGVADGATHKVNDTTYAILKPTTATLSLLVLAGLAARRRRK